MAMRTDRSLKLIFSGIAMILVSTFAVGAALPRDPDNAALVYYQAALSLDEASHCSSWSDVLDGHEPNQATRDDLHGWSCRQAVAMVHVATRLAKCDWGLVYSQGTRYPSALWKLRQLGMLLNVRALSLCADRKYRAALEQYLEMSRFAERLEDGTAETHFTAMGMNMSVLHGIGHVLSWMDPNVETLTWLQGQFATMSVTSWHPQDAFKTYGELEAQKLRCIADSNEYADAFRNERTGFTFGVEGDGAREEFQKLTDHEVITRALASYREFVAAAVQILATNASYRDKTTALRKLRVSAEERMPHGDPIYFLGDCLNLPSSYYERHMSNLTLFNLMKVATAICLVRAKTGQLPATLPAGLPKDPVSGQDFGYEPKAGEFILRLNPAQVGGSPMWQYTIGPHESIHVVN